jgi:hypothetical protein
MMRDHMCHDVGDNNQVRKNPSRRSEVMSLPDELLPKRTRFCGVSSEQASGEIYGRRVTGGSVQCETPWRWRPRWLMKLINHWQNIKKADHRRCPPSPLWVARLKKGVILMVAA